MSNSLKMIYFNNAASGWPKAPGVIKTLIEILENLPYHPGRSIDNSGDPMSECRIRLAKLLNTENPENIVLTTCATHSLNLALLGLQLGKNAKVITTVTEHNSVLRPLHHIKKKNNIDIVFIGLDGSGNLDIETFERLMNEDVKLVVINHASNVTGRVNDAKTIFTIAKKSGAITILDASQSLGHIQIKVDQMNVDIVAFTGHKALHGPQGTGGLYVSPSIKLEQIFVGGTGIRSDLIMHPQEMPLRLEAGTPNLPGFGGLAKALDWHEKNHQEFCKRANDLASMLRRELADIPNVKVFDNLDDSLRTPVVSFRIEGWEVEEVGYILSQSFGIISRTGLHCAPLIHKAIGSFPDGTIRFSLSGFNTESEVEIAVDAVRRIANEDR
ncbi:MAG: aminotransferase class V-fold PLP-dependent enzyme [bacterium]